MRDVEPNVKDYDEFCKNFKWEIPEYYNFGFDTIDEWAKKEPDKVALITVSSDGESAHRLTFKELSELSGKFASVLKKYGVKKGDRVFIMLPRIPEWYIAVIGCIKLSAIFMPTPTLSTPKDIEYRINRAEAKVAVTCSEFAERVEEVEDKCPSLKLKILIDGKRDGWISYEDEMKEAKEISREEVEKTKTSDPLLIYFTSGTESYPKMVLHTHAYPLAHWVTAYVVQDLKPEDTIWVIADTGWAKTAWGKLFGQWLIGATILQWNLKGRFNPETALKILEKYGVTVFCAPPTAYRMMIQVKNLKSYDYSKLRHCLSAGEPLNPEVIRVWKEATGLDIYDYYGQTETVALVANMRCLPIKQGSMGKPTPGHYVAIVDDDGNELPAGEEGHIAVKLTPVRPPGLMREYWKDEESNRKAFRGDWYYTGDRAYRDEDGYLWFVGRADDVIKSSGYRIGPFEVESVLLEHPAVAECAVVGVPDPEGIRGNVVKAFVVLSEGYHPSEELTKELQEHVKRQTAPYKYPRLIEYVDELPKTLSGKILRRELRKRGI